MRPRLPSPGSARTPVLAALCLGMAVAAACGRHDSRNDPAAARDAGLGGRTSEGYPSRTEFARRQARLRDGMHPEAVAAILGRPDEDLPPGDRTIYPGGSAARIFRYGTRGGGGFATLGVVCFDQFQTAFFVSDACEDPPPPDGMFPESRLRALLGRLNRAPDHEATRFDPVLETRIINELQGLGRERALAAVREYLRVAPWCVPARENLALVLACLFEPASDAHFLPIEFLGNPTPPQPADRARVPRFPLVIQDGIPLVLTAWCNGSGEWPGTRNQLRYFERHGVLRAAPLLPGADPLGALDRLERSSEWLYGSPYRPAYRFDGDLVTTRPEELREARRRIMIQLRRLTAGLHHLETDDWGKDVATGRPIDEEWERIRASVNRRGIRWNAATEQYEADYPEPVRAVVVRGGARPVGAAGAR